ncbi:LLM class flavin-dependent oxidoreductase [Candidatus Poriferisodalis sp.]|uniref:LLM class flavin-dependent oxidoreductase n=1 Tax=Candidatus Poriferisodalis sp. TaxID=3101277 RepID=UPI003B5AC186
MPLSVIGMIGVSPPKDDSTVHVIEGGLSRQFLEDFSRAHDEAGFDLVLVGYTSTSADGWSVATHAASVTERLGYLVAHRPGFVAPTLAARKAATFDQLSGGRFALHIIAGASDKDNQRDGDYLPKADRYARAGEYIDVMRRTWTSTEPFDHDGAYYRFSNVRADVQPLQQPSPPIFFGGSSGEALEMGAERCDVYAVYAEPRAAIAERFDDFRRRAAAYGRTPRFSISVRPILGDTEGEAWDRAHRILGGIEAAGTDKLTVAGSHRGEPYDHGGERMLAYAAASDVHDERLWLKIAEATGAPGNTSCLVGTPGQVAEAILRYYRLGIPASGGPSDIGYVLIRGFDPFNDAVDFGRELIPRIKAGVAELDAAAGEKSSERTGENADTAQPDESALAAAD